MQPTWLNHMFGMVSAMGFNLCGALGYVGIRLIPSCSLSPLCLLLSYQLILASGKDQQLIGDEGVIASRFIGQRNCRVFYYAIFTIS